MLLFRFRLAVKRLRILLRILFACGLFSLASEKAELEIFITLPGNIPKFSICKSSTCKFFRANSLKNACNNLRFVLLLFADIFSFPNILFVFAIENVRFLDNLGKCIVFVIF
jgi:hypothetical protein